MINIVCFGNELHADDGIGKAAYEALLQRDLPSWVKLYFAGHSGLDAVRYFEHCSAAVIVDAMQTGDNPGQILQMTHEKLLQSEQEPQHLSTHSLSIKDLLKMMVYSAENTPDHIEVFAMEAESLEPFSPGLSNRVAERIEHLADRIEHYIYELNIYAMYSSSGRIGILA